MFKLVVLSALLAVVAAKPSLYHEVAAPVIAKTYVAPAALSSTYREDVISKPAAVAYAAPVVHESIAVAPVVAKTVVAEPVAYAAPVVAKTVVSPVALSHTYREDVISKPAAVAYAAPVAVATPVAHALPAVSSSYRADIVSSPIVAKSYFAPAAYGYVHGSACFNLYRNRLGKAYIQAKINIRFCIWRFAHQCIKVRYLNFTKKKILMLGSIRTGIRRNYARFYSSGFWKRVNLEFGTPYRSSWFVVKILQIFHLRRGAYGQVSISVESSLSECGLCMSLNDMKSSDLNHSERRLALLRIDMLMVINDERNKMFKLVVLSAFLAVAMAKPSLYHEVVAPVIAKTYVAPAALSSTYREDVISKPAVVAYATPVAYAAPVAHALPAVVSSSYRADIVSSPIVAKSYLAPAIQAW
ncbi:uncharacterized protein [Euwallacea similis]|uniref:uncharacterized protein n=1 Tax=Euwallacea similis TaxID=1736056 RepID=UPI00344B37AF